MSTNPSPVNSCKRTEVPHGYKLVTDNTKDPRPGALFWSNRDGGWSRRLVDSLPYYDSCRYCEPIEKNEKHRFFIQPGDFSGVWSFPSRTLFTLGSTHLSNMKSAEEAESMGLAEITEQTAAAAILSRFTDLCCEKFLELVCPEAKVSKWPFNGYRPLGDHELSERGDVYCLRRAIPETGWRMPVGDSGFKMPAGTIIEAKFRNNRHWEGYEWVTVIVGHHQRLVHVDHPLSWKIGHFCWEGTFTNSRYRVVGYSPEYAAYSMSIAEADSADDADQANDGRLVDPPGEYRDAIKGGCYPHPYGTLIEYKCGGKGVIVNRVEAFDSNCVLYRGINNSRFEAVCLGFRAEQYRVEGFDSDLAFEYDAYGAHGRKRSDLVDAKDEDLVAEAVFYEDEDGDDGADDWNVDDDQWEDGFASIINDMAIAVHHENVKWWEDPATGERIERNRGEQLMLIVSELSEAMEGERKDLMDNHLPHRKMAEVELADALIRIMDYAVGHGYDLGSAVAEKIEYNRTREDHKPENRVKEGGKKW